jgi:hypothetical protein
MPVAGADSTTSIAKAKAKITPSPSPVWPPIGFIKSKDGILECNKINWFAKKANAMGAILN